MFLFSILNSRSKSKKGDAAKEAVTAESVEVKPTLGQVITAMKAHKALADQKRRNTFPLVSNLIN